MFTIYRESRERKGLTREEAVELVPVSLSTLRRIEDGDTIPEPSVVNSMADAYQDPYLPIRHCLQNYKIGEFMEDPGGECNLTQVVLELIDALNSVENDEPKIVGIFKNGTVEEFERPDFERITVNLRSFVRASTRLIFGGQKQTALAAATTRAAMG